LFSGVFTILNGQQLPLYTQYMNNGFLVNPAMAGYDGYTSFNLTARKQWIGFEGAPLTYSFSGQTRMLRKSYRIVSRPIRNNKFVPSTRGRVGLGGYFFNDINGNISRTGGEFTYAYHIYMLRSQLSFGLSGQFFQYKIGDDLNFYTPGDPRVEAGLDRVAFIPDANAGVYWSAREFYLGFSAYQLFESVLKIGSGDLGNLRMLRHYYLMGGYRFINEYTGFEFEPSFLFKTTEQFLPEGDLSFKVYYREDYWAGLSYRTNGSLAAMFGVRSDRYFIGYAYDYALSSIRKFSFGSHEILLSLKFGDNARRYRWLNRY
jgi:type IX secretion system PorP/SprF family membrane protein